MRRALGLLLALVLLGAATASWALESHAAPTTGTAPGRAPESAGRRLFVQGCSSCHGYDGRGVEGSGPSLVGAGEEAADFYLRTGRMPLDRPGEEPVRSDSPYTPAQIRALVAYVGALGGPPIPAVDPEAGNLAAGQKLFAEHCAGCHQILGRGGIVPGAVVPDLSAANATDVAEAVRIGPYVMPTFDQLDPGEVDDLARYVEYTHHPEDRGGWGIGHIGPIPEGMVAWLLAGAALLLAIRLIGERTER